MSNLKSPTEFDDTRHALAEYVDSMLRQPQAPSSTPVAAAETVVTDEQPQSTTNSTQLLTIYVDEKKLFIPVTHVKSVVLVDEQTRHNAERRNDLLMGTVQRGGLTIPLYDLGRICRDEVQPRSSQPGLRSQAAILRGRNIAVACDRIGEMVDINSEQIRPSRDERASRRWIQGIVMHGMVPIINVKVIKEITSIQGAGSSL